MSRAGHRQENRKEIKYFSQFFGISILLCFSAYGVESIEFGESLDEIIIEDQIESQALVGITDSATTGSVRKKDVENRPLARSAEVMETVPGLVITQHAGGGKANQYYLRGFNLDHGTNFATYLDGVPINLPTHAHGQGYTDLNLLIPELVKEVSYQKGVYYADQGDFANAGAANITYEAELSQSLAKAEAGGLGYYRGLVAGSPKLGEGSLLYALETQHSDGAWEVPQNFRKLNGFTKYTLGNDQWGYSLTAQGYYGIWLGNDQVPERAIQSGLIDRYGTLDPSTGGNSHRFSLYGDWHRQDENSRSKVLLYGAHYTMDLYSNFTYFLDQADGDSIQQKDSRIYFGVRSEHTLFGHLFEREMENTFGLQIREDLVDLELNRVSNRRLIARDRTDHVSELNIAPWYQNKIQWTSWFRTVEGIRGDFFALHNSSDNAANSGRAMTGTVSPKLSLVFGPWAKTEYYLQGGYGFRTNDIRSVFTTVNPSDGSSASRLPAIVRTRGAEAGIRTEAISHLHSTLSAWSLWSDSDTYFNGDQGTVVDANRPGVRYGLELNNRYAPLPWLLLDGNFAYSWARYSDSDLDSVGTCIPGSITSSISGGITLRETSGPSGFFGSLRWRYFGPRPLVEDNSQKSSPSSVFNLMTGYAFNQTWTLSLSVLNLFNTQYNDAEYYYSSRLRGETIGPESDGGHNDHMVHPGEPRNARIALVARF